MINAEFHTGFSKIVEAMEVGGMYWESYGSYWKFAKPVDKGRRLFCTSKLVEASTEYGCGTDNRWE